MNTIRRIHIAKTPYNIEESAHQQLSSYLSALYKSAGSKEDAAELAKEVEGRITELLAERKVTPEGVITEADIAALRTQLGEPEDFADGEPESEEAGDRSKKVFMRSSSDALLGGIASGLAVYFGGNVWLWRIALILGIIMTHSIIVFAYILTWLTVPAAKTASDSLRMAGIAVTIDNLQRRVAAGEEARSIGINRTALIIRKTLAVVTGACSVMGALIVLIAAWVLAGIGFSKPLRDIFPFSASDFSFIGATLFAATVVAAIFILGGISLMSGRGAWAKFITTLPILGTLGIIGIVASASLAYPSLSTAQERYEAATVKTDTPLNQPFTSLKATGSTDAIYIVSTAPPHVTVSRAPGAADPHLTSSVKDGVLTLSVSGETAPPEKILSILPKKSPVIRVYGPALTAYETSDRALLEIVSSSSIGTLTATSSGQSHIHLPYSTIDSLTAVSRDSSSMTSSSDSIKNADLTADPLSHIYLPTVGTLTAKVTYAEGCTQGAPFQIDNILSGQLTLNGHAYTTAEAKEASVTCINLYYQSY